MHNVVIPTVLFLLSAGLAFAAAPASIAVFLDFQSDPSEESISQMKAEASSILAPSGISLDWHSLSNRSGFSTFPDLVVFKFRGSCQVHNPAMDSELGPAMERVALASTAVEDGHVLPFSDVRCDEIRRFLAPDLAKAHEQKRDAIYGKALGRVVAHELYHILAATEQHGKQGVARRSHSRQDLTAKKFNFSDHETAMLHEVKLRAMRAGEGAMENWQ